MLETVLDPRNIKFKKTSSCSQSSLENWETKQSMRMQKEELCDKDKPRCYGSTKTTPKPEWKVKEGSPKKESSQLTHTY